ncbi:CAP domain-containing protein [Neobacillus cucumis]|uniref:Sporulation protein n=1 Tax=Neobacillus cucumis TaxID=1740721 RepID=A0A2N5HA89_9BACI|nr:CAP domain-containing protein [Neobacillus cucumis]PLS02442.1 sporulation protein [Neobacillus cucumis]
MLLSKTILTLAASGALFGANPTLNQAHSSTAPVQQKTYTTQGTNVNSDEINRMVEAYLSKMESNSQSNVNQTQPAQPTQEPTKAVTQPEQSVNTKPVQQSTAGTTNTTQTSSTLSAFEQKVVDLTNQERAKNGLPALKADTTLSKMAHEKARDMSANNYFSHTSPTYGSPFDMMKKFGITYSYAGENIAMGQQTPQEVVNAWMNSEGHRKNILSPNFNYIGVGYVAQGNYWVQDFIGK